MRIVDRIGKASATHIFGTILLVAGSSIIVDISILNKVYYFGVFIMAIVIGLKRFTRLPAHYSITIASGLLLALMNDHEFSNMFKSDVPLMFFGAGVLVASTFIYVYIDLKHTSNKMNDA